MNHWEIVSSKSIVCRRIPGIQPSFRAYALFPRVLSSFSCCFSCSSCPVTLTWPYRPLQIQFSLSFFTHLSRCCRWHCMKHRKFSRMCHLYKIFFFGFCYFGWLRSLKIAVIYAFTHKRFGTLACFHSIFSCTSVSMCANRAREICERACERCCSL